MTVLPLPSGYTWGFVVGRSIHAMADTTEDDDRFPEARGSNGRVTFTPLVRFRVHEEDPKEFVHYEVTRTEMRDGHVLDAQKHIGIYLISGWYRVSFQIEGGAIPSFEFEVKDTHTEDNPCNLASVAPVSAPPGYIEITRYEDRIRAENAAAAAEGYSSDANIQRSFAQQARTAAETAANNSASSASEALAYRDQAAVSASSIENVHTQYFQERPTLNINGGFDIPAVEGDVLPPYFISGSSSDSSRGTLGVSFFLDSEETFSGSGQSLRIQWDCRIKQRVYAKAGDHIRMTLKLKGVSGAVGSLSLGLTDINDTTVVSGAFPSVDTNNVWTEIAVSFQIPSNENRELYLRIARASSPGPFWIDDVEIYKQGPPPGITIDTQAGELIKLGDSILSYKSGIIDAREFLLNGWEANKLELYRNGDFVTLHIYQLDGPSDGSSHFFGFPVGFRPPGNIYFTTQGGTNAGAAGILRASNSLNNACAFYGNVKNIGNPNNGQTLTFITNDPPPTTLPGTSA